MITQVAVEEMSGAQVELENETSNSVAIGWDDNNFPSDINGVVNLANEDSSKTETLRDQDSFQNAGGETMRSRTATLRRDTTLGDRMESLKKAHADLAKAEMELEGKSYFEFLKSNWRHDRPDPYTPSARFSHPIYDGTKLFWQLVTLITAGLCFVESEWNTRGLEVWFLTLVIYLFAHKIYYFYYRKWLLYFIDLCYYSMIMCAIKIIGRDNVSIDSSHLFVLINGPVLGSSLLLKQRLGFYDRDVFAGFFLHVLQAWFSYYARQTACIGDGEEKDEVELFGESFLYYYIPWATFYFFAILIKPYIPVLQNFVTLYDDTVNPGVPLLTDDFLTSLKKKFLYILAHAAAALFGAVVAAFAYNNRYQHLIYLGTSFASCIWHEGEFMETGLFNVKRSGLSGIYFMVSGVVIVIIVGFITHDYDSRLPDC